MATLHVRNVPDGTYERLRAEARRRGRSINTTTIELLEQSLPDRREEMRAWMERAEALMERSPMAYTEINSVDLIREDRDSR
jgi:plasmid stability protein